MPPHSSSFFGNIDPIFIPFHSDAIHYAVLFYFFKFYCYIFAYLGVKVELIKRLQAVLPSQEAPINNENESDAQQNIVAEEEEDKHVQPVESTVVDLVDI